MKSSESGPRFENDIFPAELKEISKRRRRRGLPELEPSGKPAVDKGLVGLALCLRFLYFFVIQGSGAGKVQSLILAAMLLIVSFLLLSLGILGDLISANRRLIQDSLFATRWESYKKRESRGGRPEHEA